MKSKIIALSMALLVFAGSSMTAQAAVCPNPNAPGGVHHFNSCKPTLGGRIEDLGYHTYLYAYDNNHNPVYRSDCHLTQGIQYCRYVCFYCGADDPDGAHEHKQLIQHSISHKNE